MEEIRNNVKSYILNEFLPGENPELLTDTTQLVTDGILDSLATLKLVSYLEETFKVEIKPYEIGPEYLDTLPKIAELVQSKK